MRDHMLKKLLDDEKGAVISVFLLVLIPMFIIGVIGLTENTNIMRSSDSTLQNAVTVASRHSAMMIDSDSQAKGDPLIDHKKAYNNLVNELNYILGLDSGLRATVDPSSVKWWMLVYNGDNTYKSMEFSSAGDSMHEVDKAYSENVMPYAFYASDGSEVVTETITGFPYTLYVSNEGILDSETRDSVKVTLKEPGVLLVVNANINSLMVDNPENATRWAYAKVSKRKGGE